MSQPDLQLHLIIARSSSGAAVKDIFTGTKFPFSICHPDSRALQRQNVPRPDTNGRFENCETVWLHFKLEVVYVSAQILTCLLWYSMRISSI